MYIQNVAAVIFPILFMRASASPFASPEALALAEAMALALPAPYAMPVHGSTSTPSVPTTHGTTPAPPSTHGTTPAPPSTPAAPTPPQTNTGPHQNDLDITQLDNPKKPKKPTDAARQKENDEHAALDAGVKELGIEGKPIGAREGPHENPPGDLHVTGNVAHDDGTTSGFHVGVQQTGADPTTGAMRHEIQPVATSKYPFPSPRHPRRHPQQTLPVSPLYPALRLGHTLTRRAPQTRRSSPTSTRPTRASTRPATRRRGPSPANGTTTALSRRPTCPRCAAAPSTRLPCPPRCASERCCSAGRCWSRS